MKSSNTPERIVITNIVSLNTGDAAILWGMIQMLRQRYGDSTKFTIFDRSAGAAKKYYPWAEFRQSLFGNAPRNRVAKVIQSLGYGHWVQRLHYWKLSSSARLCRLNFRWIARALLSEENYLSVLEYVNADLVISTGGTYLTENYGLWTNIRDYRFTFSTGTPLIFFTQTLGPFTSTKYRSAFTDIFNRCSAIFLRDERSLNHLFDLGVPQEKVTLAKDAAFAIDPGDATNYIEKDALRIAVSVRSLRYFSSEGEMLSESYKSSIAGMVTLAVRDYGAEVVFLSTCQGIPEYWTDDTLLADEILESLPNDISMSVSVDRKFRQPLEIVESYKGFSLVVATRMHAAILSIVAGTPVLGIAYEFKLEELFHQLGMNEARLSVNEMTPEVSEACLSGVIDNLDAWRETTRIARGQCKQEAEAVIEKLPNV
ncbi:polysaccharide pyruvyl transferase family protein [Marinobacter salarius]|uniref:Colanic acid biosynthesis protein n=1 Tax=Marinobacter salarius TaxID=1420917 RepID=A0A1W6K9R1_9GAMM|nr:polysaccharide pyruvyl transferase family protein [Marinobacter salarius]ARM84049.1 colanic acid biosynthesis protein [Marinobacter salarius]